MKSSLRDSHELQLRNLLSVYNSLYEIGQCFRDESLEDYKTNSKEFLLMELFTKEKTLYELKKLIQNFILIFKPEIKFKNISIAEHIFKEFQIDLYTQSQNLLYDKLKKLYSELDLKNYEYVLHYIEENIEPMSKNCVVFFYDYPECTCSYANIKGNEKSNVISRFELFANEIEIANGFDDECNEERFRERNKEYPLFEREEHCIIEGLKDGSLPRKSAGIGIGIERLCMFLFNESDINIFKYPSNEF